MIKSMIGVLCLFSLVLGGIQAEAKQSLGLPAEVAVRAILGEAGPSYEERYAIACALRNRGTLHGVYGHLEAPTAKQWQAGSRAWFESEDGPDVTKGANHFLSRWDLKNCRPSLISWKDKMVKTYETENFCFYRSKTNGNI